MSEAMPMSTSLMENLELAWQMRISHIEIKSLPAPRQMPLMAAMTGTRTLSIALIAF